MDARQASANLHFSSNLGGWLATWGAPAMTAQLTPFLVEGAILFGAWWIEESDLRKAHARNRASVLNAARVGAAYVLLAVGLLVWAHSVLVVLAMGAAALALMLTPTSWLVRLGGLERTWEIRRTYDAAWHLRYTEPMPLSSSTLATMTKARSRLRSMRTAGTAEWIDIMVADIDDWIRGGYWPLGEALRLIRRHEIDVERLGLEAPPARLSPEEAKFRWHLFRLYARMLDAGNAPRSQQVDLIFEQFANELDQFRRPDTTSFIDAVQVSARSWLRSSAEAGPWPAASGLVGFEPGADTPDRALWPSLHILWGAQLDEDDRRELATSLKGED